MALLTMKKRKQYFQDLGLGKYNATNIKKFQKKYMHRSKDWDGIYGNDTDNLLRTCWNIWKYTKNFKAEEFACECNGRHCCGYPTYMKDFQLQALQAIRDHWKKPMTVTSGMRCRGYNSELNGSTQNSLHLKGQATDFYMAGVTDTLANRKKAIAWIKKLKKHRYTYGDGINSAGGRPYAPYMGNALHTDTQ